MRKPQRQLEQVQRQFEQERQRAERAEAELEQLRSENQWEARVRRLEEALGFFSETNGESEDAPKR